ncbi:PhnA domain-containing protein [Candidatus Gracilibacteria bacterium]|nr:PhnA domain-containing protein [Candidatus Gracilibacteria bacterium]
MSWLLDEEDNTTSEVVDMNGLTLVSGDSVIACKDLKVKGSADIKRGDVFKNIRLTDDNELIESGKMVLRTEFFKKK